MFAGVRAQVCQKDKNYSDLGLYYLIMACMADLLCSIFVLLSDLLGSSRLPHSFSFSFFNGLRLPKLLSTRFSIEQKEQSSPSESTAVFTNKHLNPLH